MRTYTDKAGQTHKLNTLTKLVYVYIENRFNFFKSQGKEYYDTYKDIAEYWGVEQKAVGESVNKLVSMGLVEKKIIKYRNLPKNVFTKVNPIATTTTNNIPKASQQRKRQPAISRRGAGKSRQISEKSCRRRSADQ